MWYVVGGMWGLHLECESVSWAGAPSLEEKEPLTRPAPAGESAGSGPPSPLGRGLAPRTQTCRSRVVFEALPPPTAYHLPHTTYYLPHTVFCAGGLKSLTHFRSLC